jgi:hypothetical protein
MPRVIANTEALPDDLRDALERPKIGRVARVLGTPEQNLLEFAELRLGQLAVSTRTTGPLQGGLATGFPGLIPATDGLSADAEVTNDVGLAHSSGEELTRVQTPSLLCRIVRATRRIPFHTDRLPQIASLVTVFCEAQ